MTAFKQQIQEFNGEEQIQLKQGTGRFNLFARVSQLWEQYFKDKTQALIDSSGGGANGITGQGTVSTLPRISTVNAGNIITLENSDIIDYQYTTDITKDGDSTTNLIGLNIRTGDYSAVKFNLIRQLTLNAGVVTNILAQDGFISSIINIEPTNISMASPSIQSNTIAMFGANGPGSVACYLQSLADGAAGNYLTTDGAGNYSWAATPAPIAYKVYTALVNQVGNSHTTAITSGTLTVGTTYQITDYQTGDDFTNVGALNNSPGEYFVATGGDYGTSVYPNVWTEGSELTSDDGAPTVNILENTLGNNVRPYYTYNGAGQYGINSNMGSPFVVGKTALFIGSVGDDPGAASYGFLRINSGDILNILTQDSSPTNANDMLLNTTIEIRVYN
jgi:hypothetical protein